MSKRRFILITFLSWLLLLGTSCSKDTIKAFSDLMALRRDLIKEYKVRDINVVIRNSRLLRISFVNSSFNNLKEEERANKAHEIALFAEQHYASINSIEAIWVSFVTAKYYVIFRYSSSLGSYVFDKRMLKPDLITAGPQQQGVVMASYNPASNETSVYLKKNLEVYSDPRSGIMLLPHFTIPGDNVSAPKAITPESVTLDFTTFSENRMFSENSRLVIYVDDRITFSGSAQLTKTLGEDADKSVNEFLSPEISYEQFLQLAGGQRVKFVLGTKTFELTAEHLAALRSMKSCVDELKCW